MQLLAIPRRLLHTAERGALELVRRSDPAHLRLLARRPLRDVARLVLVPALTQRFDPHRAEGVNATFELRLRHASGDGHDPVSIHIANGRCRVRPTAARSPDAVVGVRLDHLLQLVSGQTSARALLSDGRLQVTGNVLLFMRFPGMFGGLG